MATSGNSQTALIVADLSSRQSIHQFVEDFNARFDHLNLLMNCAGIHVLNRQLTVDWIELMFGTEYLGHFLLTNLLVPVLKAGAPSRIIIISGKGHKAGVEGGVDSEVYALAVDGSGNLYAGGAFNEFAGACLIPTGGTDCKYIAKWNGTTWSALGSGMNGAVEALAIDSSGNLYAGGNFSAAGTCSSGCVGIARWDSSTWTPLGNGLYDYDTGYASAARSLAYDGRGRMYVGGYFTRTDNKRVRYVSYWIAGAGQCGLAAGGDYTLYSGNMPVSIHINNLGTLDCLSVQRFNRNHPHAESYQQTSYYWSLRGVDSSNYEATAFDVQMTLPYASADASDAICRWMDDEWKCNNSSYVANTSITVDHVTHFSNWAVGNNAPTAVSLDHFNAAPEPSSLWIIITIVGMGLFMVVILVRRRQLYL